MRSTTKPSVDAFSRKKPNNGGGGNSGREPYGVSLQQYNRAAAAALAECVTRQLQQCSPQDGDYREEERQERASSLVLPSISGKRGTATGTQDHQSNSHVGIVATPLSSPPPPLPSIPLHVISQFLQEEMQQLVSPMRRDRSSRDDFERHVLLLNEYLTQGNGVHGFTPSVVLSGLAETLSLLHQAFHEGKCFHRPQQLKEAEKRSPRQHQASNALVAPSAWAGMGVESFLPPLVRRTADTTREDEQREVEFEAAAAAADDAAAFERLYTNSMSCTLHAGRSVNHTINATNASGGAVAAVAASVVAELERQGNRADATCGGHDGAPRRTTIEDERTADTLQRSPQQSIFTVPEALHALLVHLTTHPLICLTAEDQRGLSEAVSALCLVASHIVAETGNAEDGDETFGSLKGPLAPSKAEYRELTHAMRLVALEAIQSLLSPLHLPAASASGEGKAASGKSAAASVALINGHVVRSSQASKEGERQAKKASKHPLYVSVAASFARGLVEENSSFSLMFTSLFTRWECLLRDMILSMREDDERVEKKPDESASGLCVGLVLDGEAEPGSTVPLRFRQCTKELSVLLRIVSQLFDIITDSQFDPLFIAEVRASVPVLVLRTLAQSSSPRIPGTLCDVNATLCVDLLWKLVETNAAATAEAILYSATGAGGAEGEATPANNLFQALLNQMNSIHRQLHRELRNDLVAFLSAILRADAVRCTEGLAPPPSFSMKRATADALNAIALVLFDLVCGPEVGSSIGGGAAALPAGAALEGGACCEPAPLPRGLEKLSGFEVTADGGSTVADELNGFGRDGAAGEVFTDGWLALTVTLSSKMPPLTQQALKRHCATAMRCRTVASPSLRKDSLQFKRLGWQCLQLFYEWQVAHLAANLFALNNGSKEAKEDGNLGDGPGAEVCYANLVLVDLCRMGFVDVLLMYCDLRCDNPAVVAWTREEMLTLQLDAWTLLGALASTSALLAEVNSAYLSWGPAAAGANGVGEEEEEEADNVIVDGATESQPLRRVLLSPADAQFVEADGINTLLAYLHAPSSVISLTREVTSEGAAANGHHAVTMIGATQELEVQKKAALMLLSVLASNAVSSSTAASASSRVVRKALLNTPSLIIFLLSVLDNVRAVVNERGKQAIPGNGGSSTSQATNAFTAVNTLTLEEINHFFLTDSEMDVVLGSLNLLVGLGEAAAELGGGIHEIPDPSPSVSCQRPSKGDGYEGSGSGNPEEAEGGGGENPLNMTHPRWNRSSTHYVTFAVVDKFAMGGGVEALLRWLTSVLEPQTLAAVQLGANSSLTARSAISTVAKHPQHTRISKRPRAPPLLEGFLVRHLPLVSALLDVLSVLVMGSTSSESDLVNAGGVHVLLDVTEAMAMVSDTKNIFAPFMASTVFIKDSKGSTPMTAATTTVDLEPTVVIRDPTCTMQDAVAREEAVGRQSEQRIAFQKVLTYTLNILSRLLFTNSAARTQFLQWRSRRIEKHSSANNCIGSASAAMDSGPNGFMNGVQLLINLWIASLPKPDKDRGAAGGAPTTTTTTEEEQLLSDVFGASGLELLCLSVRDSMSESLRQEYIRRLMRRKVWGSHHSNPDAPNTEGVTSPTLPFSEEELVRYAVYIAQGGALNSTTVRNDREAVVASILNDEGEGSGSGSVRQQAIEAMQRLLYVSDEESEALRGAFTKELLEQKLGLGVKVYGCLAALGFESMILASDPTLQRKTDVLVLDNEDDDPRSDSNNNSQGESASSAAVGGEIVALSPAERAQLTVIAAFPALCVDEVCLAMANVALEAGVHTRTSDEDSVAEEEEEAAAAAAAGEGGESREKALIRPTTPDRRCLVGLLDDIHTRSSELAQLMAICHETEKAQATQLLDRFLVTRIRFGPSTVSDAKLRRESLRRRFTTDKSAGASTRRSVASFEGARGPEAEGPLPSVVISLSPTAVGASSHQRRSTKTDEKGGPRGSILASSSRRVSSGAGGVAALPPPRLAASVRRRLERVQAQEAERALHLTNAAVDTLHGASAKKEEALDAHDEAEAEAEAEVEVEVEVEEEEAEAVAVSPRHASSHSDNGSDEGHSTQEDTSAGVVCTNASCVLADAAHALAASAARNNLRSTGSVAIGSSASAKPQPYSTYYGPDGRPLLSLAKRRENKLAMIRNSLRKLPNCCEVGSATNPTDGTRASDTSKDSSERKTQSTNGGEEEERKVVAAMAAESGDNGGGAKRNSESRSAPKAKLLTDVYNVSTSSSTLSIVEIDLGRI